MQLQQSGLQQQNPVKQAHVDAVFRGMESATRHADKSIKQQQQQQQELVHRLQSTCASKHILSVVYVNSPHHSLALCTPRPRLRWATVANSVLCGNQQNNIGRLQTCCCTPIDVRNPRLAHPSAIRFLHLDGFDAAYGITWTIASSQRKLQTGNC